MLRAILYVLHYQNVAIIPKRWHAIKIALNRTYKFHFFLLARTHILALMTAFSLTR